MQFSGAKPTPQSSFWSALKVQRRVVGALLMREVLTRYGRHNIGFLWLFVEPMLFTLGVTALWTATGMHHGSTIPIVAFAITGYSAVLLWRNMPGRCIGAVGPNLSLMYHRNVKVLDVYLSRLLLEVAGATVSFVVLSLLWIGLEWMAPPENVLLVVLAWCLLAWFGFALALLVGALSEQTELVDKIWHPLTYLMFPLSGAAFLLDAVPESARNVLLFLPMVQATEALRDGYFGSHFTAHYDLAYTATVCAVLTLLGFAQVRKISKTVTPT
jgi:ABC-type polysaccharide/polyol phosphate export permease